MKERLIKLGKILVGFILFWVIGFAVMYSFYIPNKQKNIFIEKMTYECANSLYSLDKYTDKPYSVASTYLNRVDMQLDEDTYIRLLNKCVQKYKEM